MPCGVAAGPLAFDRRPAHGGLAFGGAPGVLAADGGLLGGDPDGASGFPLPPPLRPYGQPAKVHQVGEQDREAHREAHPEARADQEDAGQFDQVEGDEGAEDPTAPVQGRHGGRERR